jgi:hypothetical protein
MAMVCHFPSGRSEVNVLAKLLAPRRLVVQGLIHSLVLSMKFGNLNRTNNTISQLKGSLHIVCYSK